MKIAVVGCGAVGSYYGARLACAGHPTAFLLRSDYEHVRLHGVQVRSPEGDFEVRPQAAREPQEIGVVDLAVVALKATANKELARLLAPLVGPETAVLTLQNGLGNEEALAQYIAPHQILGGLCFVCLNRIAPGVIQHIAHGRIVMGEFQGSPRPRTHEIARTLRDSGVPCDVTENLARTHWEKLVWNIPFNGLGVATAIGWAAWEDKASTVLKPVGPCWPTDRLLADPQWRAVVQNLMGEIIAVANALGHAIPASYADLQINRTMEMGAYRASTLIDYELGRPLELEGLFVEPLRQARASKVNTPILERLVHVLTVLAEGRNQSSGGRG